MKKFRFMRCNSFGVIAFMAGAYDHVREADGIGISAMLASFSLLAAEGMAGSHLEGLKGEKSPPWGIPQKMTHQICQS